MNCHVFSDISVQIATYACTDNICHDTNQSLFFLCNRYATGSFVATEIRKRRTSVIASGSENGTCPYLLLFLQSALPSHDTPLTDSLLLVFIHAYILLLADNSAPLLCNRHRRRLTTSYYYYDLFIAYLISLHAISAVLRPKKEKNLHTYIHRLHTCPFHIHCTYNTA